MIAMTWERPLDGIADVPWETMLGSNAPAVIAAFNRLAGHTGPGPALAAAEAVDDLIADEVDYGYTSDAIECGYWPAGVPVIGFLARIAAAHPSDAATEAAVELIDNIARAPMDRPGASDAELDAWVDGLGGALRAAWPALTEAARLVPTARPTIEALGERSRGTLAYAGSCHRSPCRAVDQPVGDGPVRLQGARRRFTLDPRTGAGQTGRVHPGTDQERVAVDLAGTSPRSTSSVWARRSILHAIRRCASM